MARIRTIKPNLFRHEGLFEIEAKSGLPIRVAWMGLFTVADREGRFEWKPKILKLDILPWDDVPFEEVLKTLLGAGFLEQYEVNGKLYGYIPTWHLHQTVHHTESKSRLPDPPPKGHRELTGNHGDLTVNAPGDSRKEKEKEKEKEKNIDQGAEDRERDLGHLRCPSVKPKFDLESIYQGYPRKRGKIPGMKKLSKEILSETDLEQLAAAVANFAKDSEGKEPQFVMHFSTFANQWRDWIEVEPDRQSYSINTTPLTLEEIV
jgi:hypothetical protein